jgi:hypothetical protein
MMAWEKWNPKKTFVMVKMREAWMGDFVACHGRHGSFSMKTRFLCVNLGCYKCPNYRFRYLHGFQKDAPYDIATHMSNFQETATFIKGDIDWIVMVEEVFVFKRFHHLIKIYAFCLQARLGGEIC